MESRRDFLKAGAAAVTVAATRPLFGWQGANDRVRMAVIGCGNRAARVFDSFARHSQVQWVAGCEVNEQRLAGFMTPARQTFKLETVTDYRRILDRKDVDAVLIGTPDFSHARIMIDAVSAGKDVYVEKPASNSVPRINAMLDAFSKGKQIVQVGTQQRSWDYFQDAKKIVDSGQLGTISHVIITQPGTYARAREGVQPVPAGLDWNMWQLANIDLGAPVREFKPSRLSFRSWYEYGSGLVGDWGAHHVDVALWFMNADHKQPIKTMANGAFLTVPDADPEMVPDTFSISWLYDNFLMTFANGEVYMDPAKENPIENWGVYFIGNRGSLQVNRQGYAVRGIIPHVIRKQGPPPPPTAGGVTLGAGGTQIAPGAAPGGAPGAGAGAAGGRGRGGRQGGGFGGGNRGGQQAAAAPLEPKVVVNPRGGVEEDYPLDVHTQNFLDCVKSRQKPAATMEIGYNSALPCLIALESLKTDKILGWDAAKRETKAL
jgi:predicted dehydrogenase